jgi:DNA-directed RNA polymerase alpha subunit
VTTIEEYCVQRSNNARKAWYRLIMGILSPEEAEPETPAHLLDICTRSWKALWAVGKKTCGELRAKWYSRADLLKLKGIGKKSANEIESYL